MTAAEKRKLVQFDGTLVPAKLRQEKRWAPWRAEWDHIRQKFDKIPKRADNVMRGISSASPGEWFTYEQALRAHNNSGGYTAGIGYVMTGQRDLVGIDLDNCIDAAGELAPWAREIVDRVDSYTEVSPSGRGLRIFVEGSSESDWTNHQVGVEVYAGRTPRFLTVTGRHYAGTPGEVREPAFGSLEYVTEAYREKAKAAKSDEATSPVPLLLPEDKLPSVEDLDLPPRARSLLVDGDDGEDGSRVLISTTVALFKAGLSDVEVLSILASNDHAWGIASRHRRNDDAALLYLWKHHVQRARALTSNSVLNLADFDRMADELEWDDAPEDVSKPEAPEATAPEAPEATAAPQEASGMFDDLDAPGDRPAAAPEPKPEPPAAGKPKKLKYTFLPANQYATRGKRMQWMIPGVLPRAELVGVYGESGAGKSFFALDMLVSLASPVHPNEQKKWFGKTIKHQYNVAYIAAEGAIGVQDRLKAIATERKIGLDQITLHVLGDSPNILEQDDLKHLLAGLKAIGQKLDLIVLDTLAQVTPGSNENSSEDMGKALAHAKGLFRVTGATIMLIGHSGKDASKGQRGWSGLKGAMDAQLLLTKTSTFHACTVAKLKDGQGENDEYLFRLKSVSWEDPTATDEDEKMVQSCVVVPLDAAQQAELKQAAAEQEKRNKGGKPGEFDQTVLDAVREACGPGNAKIDMHAMKTAAIKALDALAKPPAKSANVAAYHIKAAIERGDILGGPAENRYWMAPELVLQAPDNPEEEIDPST